MSVEVNHAARKDTTAQSFTDILRFAYLPVLLPLIAVAILYAPTTESLIRSWNDYDNLGNTHGWLILLIVGWLLYQEVKSERRIPLQPTVWAIGVLAALSVAWMILLRVSIQSGQQLVFPVLMWLSLAALYGYAVARRCLFPVAYLYFAIPLWGTINPIFQWGTVFAVRFFLRLVGIPVYFQANEIHLPAGVLTVEGGCSGLHFFVVAMAIGALSWRVLAIKRPWLLMAFAAALAVFTNWLRVFIIAVAGYLTNMQTYLIRVDHYRFGWMLFAVAMAFFFFVVRRMSSDSDTASPVLSDNTFDAHPRPRLVILAVLALVVGPLFQVLASARTSSDAKLSEIAVAPHGWTASLVAVSTGSSANSSAWRPVFVNADDLSMKHYQRDSGTGDSGMVEVFQAQYAEQNQDKKPSGYFNSIAGPGYRLIDDDFTVPPPAGYARSLVVGADGKKWIILHTYYVGQKYFSSPVRAQIFYGLRSIVAWEPMGVFALRTECQISCDAALAILQPFLSALPSSSTAAN